MTQTAAQRRYVRLAGSYNSKADRLGRYEHVTADDLARVFLRSEGACAYCGVGIEPLHCTFDHVIPFDEGGPNTPENIIACCVSCQRTKGTKNVAEFQQARTIMVECEVCGTPYRPRWADYRRGFGRTCSRICSGTKGGRVIRLPAPA